jgi:hypothetical protein
MGLAATALPFIGQDLFGHLQQKGWPLDASSIPSAAAIVPYFQDASVVVTRQNDGVAMESRNAPPFIAVAGLISAYRQWKANHSNATSPSGDDDIQLGPVQGASAVETKEEPKPTAKTNSNPSPYRKLAPIFFRALVPDDIQQMIPPDTIRRLEEGPTEAQLQRREEARKRREEQRRKRRGLPPSEN